MRVLVVPEGSEKQGRTQDLTREGPEVEGESKKKRSKKGVPLEERRGERMSQSGTGGGGGLRSSGSMMTSSSSSSSSSYSMFLSSKGLKLERMPTDGNCLFHACSLQIYSSSDYHDVLRENVIKHIEANRDTYEVFLENGESWEDYLARKRRLGVFGNHVEIQAICELHSRPFVIYTPQPPYTPVNVGHDEYDGFPIRLSYEHGNHYNAVLKPDEPSFGAGLGLAGLDVGLADRTQVEESKKLSDLSVAEDAIRLKLQAVSDLEATERDALQAVMEESKIGMSGGGDDELQKVLEMSRKEAG
ncbi:hypothetical protein TrRE_jg3420, partial [Triparma retinervis]